MFSSVQAFANAACRPHVVLACLCQATAWLVSAALIFSQSGSSSIPVPVHTRVLWHLQVLAAAIVLIPPVVHMGFSAERWASLVAFGLELLFVVVLDLKQLRWRGNQLEQQDMEQPLLAEDGQSAQITAFQSSPFSSQTEMYIDPLTCSYELVSVDP